ncbi:hypothetical protein Vqi01_55250 [Micromonospora qiuiae]|uniref:DUF3375 domain-containing protein n=1 Tax=Micromonospora qiuiae TaxID=502268 RepID=A0ABQ4JIC9_9ACTN|nr:DUF3375 domain-containing protein [Micromonospora qiuiae]GIJ30363.1 hypothetical protein Vqi01_55250 [Micromonospora qiuiae]
MTIEFDEVEWLRRNNAAWRLLRADHAALVLSFLGRVFVEENVRSISGVELTARLADELYALNERLGAGTFPRAAKAYLDDWAQPEVGWLRKYYPPDSDEVHFDATPAVERALSWVQSLQDRSFVGTESRLNIVLELLRQMVYGAETDPDARLAELQARRDAIDDEIAKVRGGQVEMLDGAAQRDRYQQFVSTARGLLADFREVEANFRALDRALREKIATWSGSKGELLDEVVGNRHAIADSDQGRSFHAFYDFLLSPQRQQEFTDLLARVQSLDVIGAADPRMRRIHYDWLDAAERTQATVRLLSEQLRRFLDDQVWLENRRVMDLLRGIEAHALALRDQPTDGLVFALDAPAPQIVLPMERPLYRPRGKQPLDTTVRTGETDIDVSRLFEQVHVDPARLTDAVRTALGRSSQVSLPEVLTDRPLEQGLAELVTYLSLRDPGFDVVFDENRRDRVRWRDPDGRERSADLPAVSFVRRVPVLDGV